MVETKSEGVVEEGEIGREEAEGFDRGCGGGSCYAPLEMAICVATIG